MGSTCHRPPCRPLHGTLRSAKCCRTRPLHRLTESSCSHSYLSTPGSRGRHTPFPPSWTTRTGMRCNFRPFNELLRHGPRHQSSEHISHNDASNAAKELRRSRASKGRPWCGDGPPDVSAISPVPDHLQGLEEWLNLRNCELRDELEFGSPDVIARLSHLLSQGASQLASLRQGIGAQEAGAMEVHPRRTQRLRATSFGQ